MQLVDIATSSTGYHITVSKAGHSSDQTYPPGNPANPVKPDATVATQQLTISTLAIDLVGALNVRALNQFCAPVNGFDFLMTGGKLIGTQPDVPKYSSSLATGTDGYFINSGVEWDIYSISPIDIINDIAGTTSSLLRWTPTDPNNRQLHRAHKTVCQFLLPTKMACRLMARKYR